MQAATKKMANKQDVLGIKGQTPLSQVHGGYYSVKKRYRLAIQLNELYKIKL